MAITTKIGGRRRKSGRSKMRKGRRKGGFLGPILKLLLGGSRSGCMP